MSAAALAGFFAALVIHGYLRSDSGIIDGLNAIYYQDVLRRTFGDAKNFSSFFAESLNSSVFHVLWLYLKKKPTGIIA
ncbi:MAG: hypothetical protein IJT21_03675 [Synergistaceae bacterium]|nr:hypothetical protein [Synergistaceae bacterium]